MNTSSKYTVLQIIFYFLADLRKSNNPLIPADFGENLRVVVPNQRKSAGTVWRIILLIISTFLTSCERKQTLFTALSANETNIDFANILTETDQENILKYEYFYNGGGVAVGDLNNDGLPDLYFTGNQVENKLYLNKGQMQFDDITAQAGAKGRQGWKTGVTMADVNGDGWLDIYVCYSAAPNVEDRRNELYINNANANGKVSFTERAKEYGLDAVGTFTTQTTFFDYDLDGDLDAFMVNHGNMFYAPFQNTTKLRNKRHPYFGNRLYQNNSVAGQQPVFTDVSIEAGIHGGGVNFGLSASVCDLNNDGYPDLYVSNDYEEQDFLYINNKNGTFKDATQLAFGHLSRNTMGTDAADYNNDLRPDLVTLDMLPEDNRRQKLLKGPDEYDRYQLMLDSGYYHQNMRNMLQLNRGQSTNGTPVFSEIGQLAGISNTDWSWAALLADYDNDGWKDLLVTNGVAKDFTNLDFVKYDMDEARQKAAAAGLDISTLEAYKRNMPTGDLIKKLPATKVSNYVFKNNGDLTFSNATNDWGLSEPTLSTGAAYADLDNDGDLDLILNNTNEVAQIYRNNAETMLQYNYLKIKLKGKPGNSFGIGAKVLVKTTNGTQLQEMQPARGFQSGVDFVLNFGLGKETAVQEVLVKWPDGKVTLINNPKINSLIVADQAQAQTNIDIDETPKKSLFEDISAVSGLDFQHVEDLYVDFKFEPLIPYQLSKQGPKLAKADVNGDGLEDVFVGGAAFQSGKLFLQNANGTFKAAPLQPWTADEAAEDVGVAFFDADNDQDADLYVASGSNEWPAGSPQQQDRLYINEGGGRFVKVTNALPQENNNGSCVAAADFDRDGDVDVFVGGRVKSGRFPEASLSMLLRNNSKNKVITLAQDPDFGQELGMITDAVWADIDRDGWLDLVVVGEWTGIRIFHNNKGKLEAQPTGLEQLTGLWNKIAAQDLDHDGDVDFLVGNLGTNTQWKATEAQPMQMYVADFNQDDRPDPVLTCYVQGKSYPVATRDELLDQVAALRKKYVKYADYSVAQVSDIFETKALGKAQILLLRELRSGWLENTGKGQLKFHALPLAAQFSMVQGFVVQDFDQDGQEDVLVVGNFAPFRVQNGPSDASKGILLLGNGKGGWKPTDAFEAGLDAGGDVRDALSVKTKNGILTIISKNNAAVQVLRQK